jgi:hypothetical protein
VCRQPPNEWVMTHLLYWQQPRAKRADTKVQQEHSILPAPLILAAIGGRVIEGVGGGGGGGVV